MEPQQIHDPAGWHVPERWRSVEARLVQNLHTRTVRVPADPLLWTAVGALLGAVLCKSAGLPKLSGLLALAVPACLGVVAWQELRARPWLQRDPEAGMGH